MSAEDNAVSTKPMSDEERLELAKKLDEELEDFINTLPKNKTESNLSVEELKNELENHPFFIHQAPDPNQPMHPLIEGLQKLKYDPEENEPNELALAHKEDGNFHFKVKHYNLAIVAYTEGLKQKCDDQNIVISLLNNRSAAHWYLKNYRSCLKDCEAVLKVEPLHDRVLWRAAQCTHNLEEYEKSIEYCDTILSKGKTNEDALDLRKQCLLDIKLKERNERKRNMRIKTDLKLVKEVLERGYHICEARKGKGQIDVTKLEPYFPQLEHSRVKLNKDTNSLMWPVVIFYPEYHTMDYIQQFSENNSIVEHLLTIFENSPSWDKKKQYNYRSVNVYVTDKYQKLVKINIKQTLRQIYQNPDFIIKRGTPSFSVMLKGSEVENYLLSKQ